MAHDSNSKTNQRTARILARLEQSSSHPIGATIIRRSENPSKEKSPKLLKYENSPKSSMNLIKDEILPKLNMNILKHKKKTQIMH